MAKVQKQTEAALAAIAVDKFLSPAIQAWMRAQGHGTHDLKSTPWRWGAYPLQFFKDVEVPADIESSAVKAFPELAPDMVRLATAISEAKKLANDYDLAPWLSPVDHPLDPHSDRDLAKSSETDLVLNEIHNTASKCSGVHRQYRA